MPPPASAPRRAARRPDSGAALLVVIVSIAIVTAIAVDLAYSTRVSLLTAANARDELRAEYLARSGVQLSRLVLNLQSQLDGGGSTAVAAAMPRIQVWNLVPITSAFTDGIFGGAGEGGPPPGTFEARLEDEGSKVNAQLEGLASLQAVRLMAFLQLVADPRWDPLFDREDANGLRVTRTDLAVHLRDWTDQNSTTSAVDPIPGRPLVDGFGDENQPYARGEDPYEAKNAPFNSLDELYLVAGVDDDFMAAFGSQLTVYPDRNRLMNVNTDVPETQVLMASMLVDPADWARLAVPSARAELATAVGQARQQGLVSITPQVFADTLRALGYRVTGNPAALFTDRSLVYRIRAAGAVGAVERRVDAVFSFDTNQCKGAPVDTGCPLHWREE